MSLEQKGGAWPFILVRSCLSRAIFIRVLRMIRIITFAERERERGNSELGDNGGYQFQ